MADEKDLARLFEEVRRADEASAPPFAEVLGRRRRSGSRLRVPILRFAAVIVLLGATALAIVRLRERARERAAAERTMIAAWSSPTDWLLATPGRELMTEVPVLLDTLLSEPPSPKTGELPTRKTPPKGDRS